MHSWPNTDKIGLIDDLLEHTASYYWWYVDYIFVLFKSCDQFKLFGSYLCSCPIDMSFNTKTGQNSMSFLDVSVIGKQGTFTTDVCQKPTSRGAYTHFDRFLLNTCKIGMIYTLFKREHKIFSKSSITKYFVKYYIIQTGFCLKINFFIFFANFIFVVSNLKIHPAVHLNTSKALTYFSPKQKVMKSFVILIF